MATFTALVKIYSIEYFCNTKVPGLDEIFVQQKFPAIRYLILLSLSLSSLHVHACHWHIKVMHTCTCMYMYMYLSNRSLGSGVHEGDSPVCGCQSDNLGSLNVL